MLRLIRLSVHAREQLSYRGVLADEVNETIRSSTWETVNRGKLQASKDFIFEKEWNKKYYKYKQVKTIFVEEATEIVVITVYTYYLN
ncbi:MAG: hypothetical protein HQL06_04565 [Nitrospirae bacterium]|nr:hypothetical protein [Nitrospirota bacterium]